MSQPITASSNIKVNKENVGAAADIAASRDYQPLTMDRLMAFCTGQLQKLDASIQAKLDGQNNIRSLQNDIEAIKGELKTGGNNGGNETAFDDGDKVTKVSIMLDKAIAKAEAAGCATAALNLRNVKEKLLAGGDNKVGLDELEAMHPMLDAASSACSTSADASLVELQAEVGRRANLLQLTTGMMNSLNTSTAAIVANIGRT